MTEYFYIDCSDMPEHFDVADAIAMGLHGADLLAWMKDRKKVGIPPPYVPKKTPKAGKSNGGSGESKSGREGNLTTSNTNSSKTPHAVSTGGNTTQQSGNVTQLRKPAPEPDLDIPPEFSEDSLAEKFTETYSDIMLFVHPWNRWMEWTDSVWKLDESGVAQDYARKVCKRVAAGLQDRPDLGVKADRIAVSISSRNTFSNVERIAQSDRRHVALPKQFDSDAWILNTPDGVIELKTGQVRPARRDDYVSKQAGYSMGGTCPTWINFLDFATEGDTEVQAYLQRVAGYCLTGAVSEHTFFFFYGEGGTGKGTYTRMLQNLLNDYWRDSNIDTFTAKRFQAHSSELAKMAGARLVTAQETDAGSRWAEARVKLLTGGDPITAALKHKDEFTFIPQLKLLFTGNNKPGLRNVDGAMKRRLHIVPFMNKWPDDKIMLDFDEQLKEEGGGILEWAVEGCLEWQKTMLNPPERVKATTEEYFESQDAIGNFFEEANVTVGQFERVKTSVLYAAYGKWAETAGEYRLPKKHFREALSLRGLNSENISGVQIIEGISLPVSEDMWHGD